MKFRYIVAPLILVLAAFTLAQSQDRESSVNGGRVEFKSEPPEYGRVGVQYSYTAHAVSSDSGVIRYSLGTMPMMSPLPMGAVIDSVTGLFTWTPTLRGFYMFTIVATSSKGGKAAQTFTVAVGGGNGIIQGKVSDTLNHGVQGIIVEAFKIVSDSVRPGPASTTGGMGNFSYWAKTDANGNYRIAGVDPGQYKLLEFSPAGLYASQWYDGKLTAELANVVTIADSPAVTIIDFRVRAIVMYTVSGTVRDSTGPVKTANVFFVRAGFALNGKGEIDDYREFFDRDDSSDSRMDGVGLNTRHARVDSTGHYSLQVTDGSYIAFARAPGYATVFYQQQFDFLSATVLQIHGDLSNINFTLTALPPVVLGGINGSVLDTAKATGVRARVIAMRDRWRVPDPKPVPVRAYVTDTDSTGAYSFKELVPGTYIVLAVPLGNYVPAFYSTDTSNFRWLKATPIVINGNTVNNVNIYVRPMNVANKGFTGVSGHVQSASGATAGAIVYASQSGKVAGYTFTDISGNYTIYGIAPGSYSISVDAAGYAEVGSKSVSVGYTATGSPQTASANFSVVSVTSVDPPAADLPANYGLEQNFPNPFNPSTTIRYTLPSPGHASLKVYNLIGQQVISLVDQVQEAGTYQVTFNASNLASGVYFYRLQSGSFSQIKRMVLLK